MIFTKFRLKGWSYAAQIDIPVLNVTPSDPYILKEGTGLGPPEINLAIADTMGMRGVYNGRRTELREIVLRIGLNPNYSASQTAESLRTGLYNLLSPGVQDEITFQIVDGVGVGTVVAETKAYVKRFEIVPFAKEPEVQITLSCLRPYFESPTLIEVIPGGTKAAFTVNNPGTAPTDFYMSIVFTAAYHQFQMWRWLNSTVWPYFSHNYAYLSGDTMRLDTGARTLVNIRNAVSKDIRHEIGSASDWLTLHTGLNTFYIPTANQGYNWEFVRFKPKYWGI